MPTNKQSIALHIHKELLDSVFGREAILNMGVGTCVISSAVSYIMTADQVFLWFILASMAVFTFWSRRLEKGFKESAVKAASVDVRRREQRHVYESVASASGLGLTGSYAAFFYPDTVSTIVTLGIVISMILVIAGRNFGSLRSARLAGLACGVPMMVAYVAVGLHNGQSRFLLTALLLAAVYVTSVEVSRYFRALLIRALAAARHTGIISRRFDVAISSMPNGLVMVDGKGRVAMINSSAAEALRVPGSYRGELDEALRKVFDDGDVALISLEQAISVLDKDNPGIREFEAQTLDGRWLQLEFRKLDRPEEVIFSDDSTDDESAAVLIIQDITEKVRSKNDLQVAARLDKLTGIPNRSWWETLANGLVETLRPTEIVALCILDVDRFKLINDTLGHHIGDEVIAGVAGKLATIVDTRIAIGRLGGDEFVVVFAGLSHAAEATRLFDLVFSLVSTTYVIEGHHVEVRCSGGVIVREKQTFSLHEDMSRADAALYTVKRSRDRSWLLFDDVMEEEYVSNSRIKNDLRGAIASGELQVVYQPIYDVTGRKMISTEALCRWEHSEAGYISPSQFIGMAEEIGVIGKLTEYVLRTACKDCQGWGADVGVSVNLSALDLARDDIVGMIRKALEDFDLPASCLCIEVTETVFVKDFAKTATTLRILRSMGVKTSLDDFGTGYSSLSYLNRLPLNRVKIDRSFVLDIVDDPKAQRLFKGVVSLAKALGFEIVVEGVEGADQLAYIRSVEGVDMIQGYIFSRLLTAAAMEDGRGARIERAGGGPALKLVGAEPAA